MLKTIRARAAVAAALMTVAASPAAAENYEILMMENAFFPELSFVQPGDTVTFINMSGIARSVEALDSSWQTASLQDGESAILAVAPDTFKEFRVTLTADTTTASEAVGNGTDGTLTDDNVLTDGGGVAEEVTIEGMLNFDTPPQIITN